MAVGGVGARGAGATLYKQLQARRDQKVAARREAEQRAEAAARREAAKAAIGNMYQTASNFLDQSLQLTVQAVTEKNTATMNAKISATIESITDIEV
jgi:NAD(P)-dependent dehydrogenase (short-subunit alcohol dehydrogenase family)